MTAIGRPLRGAQLVQPIQQPRVADGRPAAAPRQRAAIRQAFQPLPGASGTGSIRSGVRLPVGAAVPRTAVVVGLKPRGRVGVSAWSATDRSGLFGVHLSRVIAAGTAVFAAAFVMLYLSLQVTTAAARRDELISERARIVEEIRIGEMDMSRLGREPAVRRRAFELGISQLADPLIVEGR